MGHLPDELRSQTVASEAELRSILRLRTYADLAFDVESITPRTGELPAVAHVPSLVETIPVEHVSIELAQELTEAQQAGAVEDGIALPEVALSFAATPARTKLPDTERQNRSRWRCSTNLASWPRSSIVASISASGWA